jgi:DNA-binding LacI/PurR family transcriptional regulator
MNKSHNWTIHDIARQAGVSAKTVSRVINDEPGVSGSTRSRITKIITEVGFEPHMGARSMRSHRRDCVGVALSAPPNEAPLSQRFFIWLFNQLYQTFGMKGDFICFDPHPPVRDAGRDYARGLWQQRYAGCIIVGPISLTDTTLRRVHESGHPYVAFGRLDTLPECNCATVDYEMGTRMSVDFLLKRGHRRIAMLKAFSGYQPGAERMRGYRAALDEANIPFEPDLVRSVALEQGNIANAVHRLLLDPNVTALIDCSAAEDAHSIREGARRAGRVPGKDFEIVSWTYTDNATVLQEASAHVWLPVVDAANEGVELFAKWFHGESEGPIRVLYRPTLYEYVSEHEVPKPVPLFHMGL